MDRLNWILLVLVLVSFALWLFEPEREDNSQALAMFLPQALDEQYKITEILIQREPLQPLQLKKGQHSWQVFEAGKLLGAANMRLLNPILSLLDSQSYRRFAANKKDLKHYGLSSPSTSLTLNQVSIQFGLEEPLYGRRYVLIGDTIHLLDSQFYYLLRTASQQFVDEAATPKNGVDNQTTLSSGR